MIAFVLQYVFGIKDTLTCLDMGAVETLLVWENLDCDRYEVGRWHAVKGQSVAVPLCKLGGGFSKHTTRIICGAAQRHFQRI